MIEIKHTIEIIENHSEGGVEIDLVFHPANRALPGATPGYLIGATILKAFETGELEKLIAKYLNGETDGRTDS